MQSRFASFSPNFHGKSQKHEIWSPYNYYHSSLRGKPQKHARNRLSTRTFSPLFRRSEKCDSLPGSRRYQGHFWPFLAKNGPKPRKAQPKIACDFWLKKPKFEKIKNFSKKGKSQIGFAVTRNATTKSASPGRRPPN